MSCEETSQLKAFDWNKADPNKIGTAHKDTTCNVWDLNQGVIDFRVNTYQNEVYDFFWGGIGIFSIGSADGSLRVFDLRAKGLSQMVYESPKANGSMTHLQWNKQDPRFLAAINGTSFKVVLVDTRFPMYSLLEFSHDFGGVNTLAWAPNSPNHIATGNQYSQLLIWDLVSFLPSLHLERRVNPVVTYPLEASICQLKWYSTNPEYIAVRLNQLVQLLRISETTISLIRADQKYF